MSELEKQAAALIEWLDDRDGHGWPLFLSPAPDGAMVRASDVVRKLLAAYQDPVTDAEERLAWDRYTVGHGSPQYAANYADDQLAERRKRFPRGGTP